jgi:hypothetical protein
VSDVEIEIDGTERARVVEIDAAEIARIITAHHAVGGERWRTAAANAIVDYLAMAMGGKRSAKAAEAEDAAEDAADGLTEKERHAVVASTLRAFTSSLPEGSKRVDDVVELATCVAVSLIATIAARVPAATSATSAATSLPGAAATCGRWTKRPSSFSRKASNAAVRVLRLPRRREHRAFELLDAQGQGPGPPVLAMRPGDRQVARPVRQARRRSLRARRPGVSEARGGCRNANL